MKKPKPGDKVRAMRFIFGNFSGFEEFELEEFHYCLGFFESENHRIASRFTPLCDLIEPSPESKNGYISNFGEYNSEYVTTYEIIEEKK